MPVSHVKSNTIADAGGTASDLVRPSDWNSVHNMVLNAAGNTLGTSQISGTDIVWAGGSNITLSMNGSTVSIQGGAGYTALSYQNRQLGASGTTSGQNAVWLVPMRIVAPVSASTLLHMVSISGASSSNTGSCGITHQVALYKVTQTTNLSVFHSIWTAAYSITGFVSSSNSVGFTVNGGAGNQNLTTASANSAFLSAFSGMRQITFNIGSTLDAGLYAFGYVISSSSVGNSAALRAYTPLIDNPQASGQGLGFGAATNASIGYADAGTFSATSAALPASFAFSQIIQVNNIFPYVKIGGV